MTTYSCECPCGATRYKVHGDPITRFYCHCTICQQQYQSPYVDVSLFKLDQVELPEDENIQYGRFKRIAAVDRGRCPNCDKPILSKMGKDDKAYAFVEVRNNRSADALPPPAMHVFYGTRVEDIDDHLPKYSNGLSSRFAFIKYMAAANKH